MDIYNREKLYEEVWNEPVTIVAKKYGVSDVAINKACKKMNIPTPGVGYWQKVKAGAKIDRPKLPKKGEELLVKHIGHTQEYATFIERKEDIKLRNIQRDHEYKIKVSEQLRNPHPLVEQAYKVLKNLWENKSSWGNSREKDPVYHLDDDMIDIRVSKSSAHRALCIMDAVIKALISEEYSVTCGIKWRKHTHVMIDGEAIGFRLHEHIRQILHEKTEEEIKHEKKGRYSNTPKYDHIPTGKLALTIEYYYLPRKSWKDTEKHRLEDCLDEFIDVLKMAAAQSKIETEKRLVEERKRQEEQECRRLQVERRAKEIERFELLEKDANDWQRSQIIKNYIDVLEASLGAVLTDGELSQRREYVAWARKKIEWVNPLVAKEDEILGYRNKK